MGLPWRAIEAIHWQMGPEEMAQRANVPVFQPHNTQRSRSPPPSTSTRSVANPVQTPTTPSGLVEPLPQMPTQTPSTRQRRSSSTSSRRRANSARQNERPQLAPVSESEPLLTAPTSDPQGYRSDGAALTPGSSVEWNGSPPTRTMPEERLTPEIAQQRNLPPQMLPHESILQQQHQQSHHRTHSQTSVQSGELVSVKEE